MSFAHPTAVSIRKSLRVPTAVRPGSGAALAALVGALVIGILGMHALSTHATPAATATVSNMTGMTGMGSAQDVATTSHAQIDVRSHDAGVSAHPSSRAGLGTGAASSSGHGSGHDMAGMLMLCVVMLAAAALTLLALLAVRISRPLLPAAFMPAAVRTLALQWVRGTGPPHEWQFSVTRC